LRASPLAETQRYCISLWIDTVVVDLHGEQLCGLSLVRSMTV
jgi:hypothetical protein